MPTSDDNGPVNLLALDGGGVRGVSELVILHEIMLEIQRRDGLDYLPKPCDYFHLIGGTSTGGLVAIMLGRLRMSTAEALDEYDGFAKKIFRFRNRKMNLSERFGATELQKAVQQIVTQKGQRDLMLDPDDASADKCRAFVCAMPAGERSRREPRRLRTYAVENDHWGRSCTIWEAARATSAAPSYFKPMAITGADGDAETFIDAAMGCNNPSAWLLEEAGEVFDRTRQLGCVVSLGTGTRARGIERASSALGVVSWAVKLIMLLKDIVVDCEKQHAEMETKFKGFADTYFRFNVPDGAATVGLAEYKKMGTLKEMTQAYLRESASREAIGKVADILRNGLTRGLTVGHLVRLDADLIVTSKRNAIPRGLSSGNFTGRRQILDGMDAFFSPRSDASPRREMLLYGMGGIGKTQIALKFAEDHQERFGNNIFWADATDQITLEQSYKAIAKKLYKDKSENTVSVTDTVSWLEEATEDWFLVFDNYSDNTEMANFLPSCDKGSILYTSRENTLKMSLPEDAVVEVHVMEEQDSITLLLRAAKIPPETPASRALAQPVVTELGNLPLAIDQAGAYMNMTQTRLDSYLNIFRERKKDMLRDDRFKGKDARSMPVYASFDLSYDAIMAFTKRNKASARSQHARYALQIISMLCFYHNEDVPVAMLRNAALLRERKKWRVKVPLPGGDLSPDELLDVDKTSREWLPLKFEDGALLLEQFSLVKWRRQDQALSMHVLVHSWRRDSMDDDDRRDCGVAARCILFESLMRLQSVQSTAETASFRRRLMPHMFACNENATSRHEEPLLESEYDVALASMLEEVGRYRDAEDVWKRRLDVILNARGSSSAYVDATIGLGDNLVHQYDFDGAAPLLKFALEKRIELFGEDDYRTQVAKMSLANLYMAQERREDAADLVRQVHQARKDASLDTGIEDTEHWNLARLLSNIDHPYGGEPMSLQLAEEELAAVERIHGTNELAIMDAKSAVGLCLMEHNRLSEAENIFLEVHSYFKRVFGEHHPKTRRKRSDLAHCFCKQGRYIEAEAIAVMERTELEGMPGSLYSSLAEADHSLAVSVGAQGRIEDALAYAESSYRSRGVLLGPSHPLTKVTWNLAEQYQRLAPRFTPYLRASLRRDAVMASRSALGEDAPEWMVREYEDAVKFEERVARYGKGDEPPDEWIMENLIKPMGLEYEHAPRAVLMQQT